MDLLAKEGVRLLQGTTRTLGLIATSVGLVCLAIPGLITPVLLVTSLPLFALLAVAHARVGSRLEPLWIALGAAAGLGVLLIVQLPSTPAPASSLAIALLPVAAGALPAFAPVLIGSAPRMVALVAMAAASVALISIAGDGAVLPVAATAFCWLLLTFLALWLRMSARRAAWRIVHIGLAHRVERQASETEAQRRQGARLLHDTVLATLTLLAHSGVGVSAELLREQAAADAQLLRQLRLGATPTPQASGQYNLEPVSETVLGTTLESVKQRFRRMGLEVNWHGTGQVLLPSDVLDAFLMALAECLENVRRHSGVTQAHVTITTDDDTVRAMVTDSGIGFELDGVQDHKLGFRESVVGRLREVGGDARLFSTPGQGTTVVLEVPR